MGPRMSVSEIQPEKIAAGKKRTKKQREAICLRCCRNPTYSNDDLSSETPSFHKKNIKKSKKCLYENTRQSPSYQSCEYSYQKLEHLKCRKAAGKGSYLASYFKIFDDDIIQDFLWMDQCFILADNYLLAIIYTYFRRANMNRREYNRTNFFAALYLAHDMEEDNEDLKLEIYPWALGDDWRDHFDEFVNQKDDLLKRIDYRAAVSKQTADEVMALCPNHPIWRRVRKEHHGGAQRVYPDEEDSEVCLRGRNASPPSVCSLCFASSDENKTSSTITSGYFSESTLISPSTILDDFPKESKTHRSKLQSGCFVTEE